jgi:hypothetical protein
MDGRVKREEGREATHPPPSLKGNGKGIGENWFPILMAFFKLNYFLAKENFIVFKLY